MIRLKTHEHRAARASPADHWRGPVPDWLRRDTGRLLHGVESPFRNRSGDGGHRRRAIHHREAAQRLSDLIWQTGRYGRCFVRVASSPFRSSVKTLNYAHSPRR